MATYASAYICLIDDGSAVQEGEGFEEGHTNRYNLPSWRAGGRKVSISEVMDAVKRIQERLPLGYAFWDRYIYSPDPADDLGNLDPLYVRGIIYQHDGHLPRYYFRLTAPGRDYARRVLERLQRDVVEVMEKETAETIRALERLGDF
jgi:hypothetical protein